MNPENTGAPVEPLNIKYPSMISKIAEAFPVSSV